MADLTLNGKSYALAELAGRPTQNWQRGLTAYEIQVLQFCRQWLSGQAEFVLRTSGSTGQPKAISLSRAQMQASAQLTGQALNLQAGDQALVCLSTAYIAGMMMLVRGFELDLRLTIIDPSRNPLADFPAETRFDFTALVPLQLHHILTDTPEKRPILNRMKAILLGGAPVGPALQAQLQPVTAPVYHTYGMTETVTHIALKRLNGPQAEDYFKPLPEVKLSLDERGCLTIQAPMTEGETVHTNDLVELRPDGAFRWLGRLDNVINSGGVKVQAEKVEAALECLFWGYPGGMLAGRRFCVGPLPHERLGQAVVAVIEGSPFSAELEAELRANLGQWLTNYEIPKAFFFADKLSETPTGKIDRLANLADRRFPDEP